MDKYIKAVSGISEMRNYAAKAVIAEAGNTHSGAGMILDGYAFLESIDHDGFRRIIDIYKPGDIFIERYFPVSSLESIYLIARSKCRAVLFDIGSDFRAGESLVLNEKEISFEKIYFDARKRLLAHVHILGQHTLRQKLHALFEYIRAEHGENPFEMEISFSDAADYIGADRSAMMREIKKMTDDGLIKHEGRKIELLK